MGCDIGPLYDEGQEQEIGELEKVIKLTCNSIFTPDEYAKTLYNAGYRKIAWHKVADGDLPKKQGQKVWLCTTSKDYFMANYWDDTEVGGKQFFEVASAGRITLSNVLA